MLGMGPRIDNHTTSSSIHSSINSSTTSTTIFDSNESEEEFGPSSKLKNGLQTHSFRGEQSELEIGAETSTRNNDITKATERRKMFSDVSYSQNTFETGTITAKKTPIVNLEYRQRAYHLGPVTLLQSWQEKAIFIGLIVFLFFVLSMQRFLVALFMLASLLLFIYFPKPAQFRSMLEELATKSNNILLRSLVTLPRDLSGIFLLLRVRLDIWSRFHKNRPVSDYFIQLVKKHPDKLCIIEVNHAIQKGNIGNQHYRHSASRATNSGNKHLSPAHRLMTFSQLNQHANKYANYFGGIGFKNGQVISLFLENGIEFFACWLGLSKLGVITAWMNTNLKCGPLANSVYVSGCTAIVTSRFLLPILVDAIKSGYLKSSSLNAPGSDDRDENVLTIYVVDASNDDSDDDCDESIRSNLQASFASNDKSSSFDSAQSPEDLCEGTTTKTPAIVVRVEKISQLLTDSSEPLPIEKPTFKSVLCYIYTSGTTGQPKAAIIRHYRFWMMAMGVGKSFGVRPNDRLYIALPMYHSAAGILGIGQIIVNGCTAVVRRRFSVTSFWKDCLNWNCTVSQYIGEICRYLLAQPYCHEEQLHSIRLMFGNGLRPQIWSKFVQRFHIDKIGELYGSTEGNSNLMNLNNRVGSCGFMPIYSAIGRLYPVRLLKVDDQTGELVRNSRGFCIPCRPGDTGEVSAAIRPGNLLSQFEGYTNQADTEKKILKDATRVGETLFTSGDILHWDRLGYMYFVDRRGDTFRWKGENVSTFEVEGVFQPLPQIRDATVYGVEVPDREGRAGMVALSLEPGALGTDQKIQEFIIGELTNRLRRQLAPYAIPMFLRVCQRIDGTGTFKLKKTDLIKAGYNLDKCAPDPVFFWDSGAYSPLTSKIQQQIDAGEFAHM